MKKQITHFLLYTLLITTVTHLCAMDKAPAPAKTAYIPTSHPGLTVVYQPHPKGRFMIALKGPLAATTPEKKGSPEDTKKDVVQEPLEIKGHAWPRQ